MTNRPHQQLGQRLRKARQAAGLTQDAVAAHVGVERPQVTQWESGRRRPGQENMIKLAALLNVSLDYLAGCTDDPSPPSEPKKTPEERLKEAGIEVWLRGEGLTDEDAEVIKAVMESLRKRREGKGEKPGP